MKNQNLFQCGLYVATEFLAIFVVMGIFRWITDRQVAALIAGSLFVLIPSLVLCLEFRNRIPVNANQLPTKSVFTYIKKLFLFGHLQFLIFFAIPIFLLRVLNWGTAFDQLSLFNIPAPVMHALSSKSYSLMLLTSLVYLGMNLRNR